MMSRKGLSRTTCSRGGGNLTYVFRFLSCFISLLLSRLVFVVVCRAVIERFARRFLRSDSFAWTRCLPYSSFHPRTVATTAARETKRGPRDEDQKKKKSKTTRTTRLLIKTTKKKNEKGNSPKGAGRRTGDETTSLAREEHIHLRSARREQNDRE